MIPIYWVQLQKLGSSSQEERKKIFEQVFKLFDLRGMTLLADREYVGQQWFKFLKANQLNFVIRLRWADYYEHVDAQGGLSYEQMAQKCVDRRKLLKKRITLLGQQYHLLMMPNPKAQAEEPVMIFLTTLLPTQRTAQLYAKRWKIECLFRHLKSNGYNLEEMNLKDVAKHYLMMALVSVAYVLAIIEGTKRLPKIAIQQYRDGSQTLEVSIFREGLSFLTQNCFSLLDFLKYVFSLLKSRRQSFVKMSSSMVDSSHFKLISPTP
ncbi:transposase [Haliscomenobacter hydrossis]|uniref:transposase n=1 Tax=Haliscomenobacter hydrossis TaxID=2350 RepID=UPI0002D45F88|nr:transposase [Haliscomenobacter hydrossis]